MAHYPLHLVTRWKSTVGISALTCVNQALNTSLYAELSGLLWVTGRGHFATTTVKIKPKFFHLMRMTILLITSHAQIKILTDGAVISRLY